MQDRILRRVIRLSSIRVKNIPISLLSEDDRFDNSKAIYLFTLNKKTVLDGDTKSNTAKYINHTCDPNCEVDIIKGKIWIIATQDIKKGDELSYDYGFGYDKDVLDNFLANADQKIVVVIL